MDYVWLCGSAAQPYRSSKWFVCVSIDPKWSQREKKIFGFRENVERMCMWNRCLNSGQAIFHTHTHVIPSISFWSNRVAERGDGRDRANSFVSRLRFSCAIFGDENIKLSFVAKKRWRGIFKCSHGPSVSTSAEKIKYFHLRRHFFRHQRQAAGWMLCHIQFVSLSPGCGEARGERHRHWLFIYGAIWKIKLRFDVSLEVLSKAITSSTDDFIHFSIVGRWALMTMHLRWQNNADGADMHFIELICTTSEMELNKIERSCLCCCVRMRCQSASRGFRRNTLTHVAKCQQVTAKRYFQSNQCNGPHSYRCLAFSQNRKIFQTTLPRWCCTCNMGSWAQSAKMKLLSPFPQYFQMNQTCNGPPESPWPAK